MTPRKKLPDVCSRARDLSAERAWASINELQPYMQPGAIKDPELVRRIGLVVIHNQQIVRMMETIGAKVTDPTLEEEFLRKAYQT